MSDDYKRQQAELTAEHVAKQDVVITTALIPGRPAPKLISAKMVESMKPGSVIVDLAAERGGNCELTKPGEIFVTENGVKIIGTMNFANKVPATASALYAKNLFSFVETLHRQGEQELRDPVGRRTRQGDAADQGRQARPSELLAEAA